MWDPSGKFDVMNCSRCKQDFKNEAIKVDNNLLKDKLLKTKRGNTMQQSHKSVEES